MSLKSLFVNWWAVALLVVFLLGVGFLVISLPKASLGQNGGDFAVAKKLFNINRDKIFSSLEIFDTLGKVTLVAYVDTPQGDRLQNFRVDKISLNNLDLGNKVYLFLVERTDLPVTLLAFDETFYMYRLLRLKDSTIINGKNWKEMDVEIIYP